MTTPPHDDQARDLIDTLSDLEHTLWAFQGLSDVLDPDHILEDQSRANVSTLISILTERFKTLLDEVEQHWRSTEAPVSKQPVAQERSPAPGDQPATPEP